MVGNVGGRYQDSFFVPQGGAPVAQPASIDLSQLVSAAVQVAQDAHDNLDHYLRFNYVRMANKLYPLDYTRDEMMAMNAVMAKALSRKLAALGTGDVALDDLIGVLDAEVSRRPDLRVIGTAN